MQRCFNVDLTLCDVTTSYQPESNIEPTLKCLLGSILDYTEKCFFNLKFQMSKHGMSCTLEKIIMAEVSGHRLRIHERA